MKTALHTGICSSLDPGLYDRGRERAVGTAAEEKKKKRSKKTDREWMKLVVADGFDTLAWTPVERMQKP